MPGVVFDLQFFGKVNLFMVMLLSHILEKESITLFCIVKIAISTKQFIFVFMYICMHIPIPFVNNLMHK